MRNPLIFATIPRLEPSWSAPRRSTGLGTRPEIMLPRRWHQEACRSPGRSVLCSAVTRSRRRACPQVLVMQHTPQRPGVHPEGHTDPMTGSRRRRRHDHRSGPGNLRRAAKPHVSRFQFVQPLRPRRSRAAGAIFGRPMVGPKTPRLPWNSLLSALETGCESSACGMVASDRIERWKRGLSVRPSA